jgi:hypothetical protein
MSEKIYINLVPNPKYTEGSNLPILIGPSNPSSPEGRTGLLVLKCLMALGGIKLRFPAKQRWVD